MSTTLEPVIHELHRIHPEVQKYLHQHLAQEKAHTDQPPMPVITVERRGRKHTDSWFEPNSWEKDATQAANFLAGGKTISCDCSITIAAEILGERPERIVTALAMAMVQHSAHHNNALQKTVQNGYHTHQFALNCAAMGIQIKRDITSGGFRIVEKLMPQFKKLVRDVALDPNVFDLFRKEDPNGRVFKGSGLKKWSCGCTNLRASVYFEGQCLACGNEYQYVDKDMHDPSRVNVLKEMKHQFDAARKKAGKRFFRKEK